MRSSPLALATLAALGLAACTTPDSRARIADTSGRPVDSGAAVASAASLGQTTGLETPESVRYDSTLDVYFVSNIKGDPAKKDNDASIVIIDAATRKLKGTLAQSGKNGVQLNAPKGIAIIGDTLWVADIDALRSFNKRTGVPISTVDLTRFHVKFLNDVVIGGDGAVYVTDSGDMGKHPFGQVIRVAGGKASVIASGDSLKNPNGIAWDAANKRFIVVQMGGPAVMSLAPNGGSPKTIATGPGQFDGVELLGDGRVLVTSWTDSTVQVVKDSTMSALFANVPSPADICVDTRRRVLAVPELMKNQVVYYRIP